MTLVIEKDDCRHGRTSWAAVGGGLPGVLLSGRDTVQLVTKVNFRVDGSQGAGGGVGLSCVPKRH